MLKRLIAGAGLGLALLISPALADDVTIHMLHVDQVADPLWKQIAADYTKAHPGVKVEVQFMENEAFKAKLPTLLQSKDRPDIIYSWAGGVMQAQADAGYLQDISSSRADFEKLLYKAPLDAYQIAGKQYGIPAQLSLVGFWYNKALVAKAGVDVNGIKTWDDFLAAVKKIKAAGITPIIMAGGDKWPMHFYYSYLLMRLGGSDVLADAKAGKDGGFTSPPFVNAGKMLKELSDLNPYQDGWQSEKFDASQGMFGDGKGAFDLMGNWLLGGQAQHATDGKGLSLDQIGLMAFPSVAGGKGQGTDVFGGVQGFLVTKDAPPAAVDFLKFFSTPEEQKAAAAAGAYISAVKGTEDFITNPLVADAAKQISGATWLQNFLDQDLGPSVGGVVNDMSVAVAAGQTSPEDAAKNIQDAWDQR